MRRESLLALGYLAALSVVWLVSEWVAERTLPTLLLAYAPPVLWLLPALPVWLWVLFRRRRVGAALLATLVALWSAGFLHWRWQSAGDLRVLTYNVARGEMTSPARLAAFLIGTEADIILLQETNFVDPKFGAALALALPGYQVFSAAEVTTISRLPMQAARAFPFGPPYHRAALLTPVTWHGQTLQILNAHLGTVMFSPLLKGNFTSTRQTRQVRGAQVATLRGIALQLNGPTLLGGDLNTPPRGLVYHRLQELFGPDSYDQAGRGPGWTYPGFKLRIDHQLARDLWPTRASVLPGAGSDHLPLLVQYKLPYTGLGFSPHIRGKRPNVLRAAQSRIFFYSPCSEKQFGCPNCFSKPYESI